MCHTEGKALILHLGLTWQGSDDGDMYGDVQTSCISSEYVDVYGNTSSTLLSQSVEARSTRMINIYTQNSSVNKYILMYSTSMYVAGTVATEKTKPR